MATKIVDRPLSRATPRPRVLIVGLGGLGCPAAELLAHSRVCDFLLADGDVVDRSNLPRQWLYEDSDQGRKKTEVARERLHAWAPELHIDTQGAFSGELPSCALVVDGCDDVDLKFGLSDAAVRAGIPIVTGGLTGLRGFVHTRAGAGGPCLRCIFEGPTEETRLTCRDAGVLSSLALVVGSVMAAAALRVLSEATPSRLWSIDLEDGRARSSDWPKRSDCPACGGLAA